MNHEKFIEDWTEKLHTRLSACLKRDEIMETPVWVEKIPSLSFPSHWKIQIIPPFCGAIVRFRAYGPAGKCSVYLDGYYILGCFDGPYWEVFSDNLEFETERCHMEDVDGLMTIIKTAIEDVYEEKQ